MWNKLIAVINNPKTDADTKRHAEMLLDQYNTAGGWMMKDEIENFLYRHKELV